MALYSKPVRILMKEMAADLAKAPDAIFSKQDAIKWFAREPKDKGRYGHSACCVRGLDEKEFRTVTSAFPALPCVCKTGTQHKAEGACTSPTSL